MMKAMFAALAVIAGMAVAMQTAANSALTLRIGLGSSLIINTTVVLLANIVLWACLGARTEFFPGDVPWTYYIGGFCGFTVIAIMALSFPQLGGAWAVALLVLGQGMAALAVDHFGLMGMPQNPVTLLRLAGLALVVGGAVLLRW
jgi:transporter family-2 protein